MEIVLFGKTFTVLCPKGNTACKDVESLLTLWPRVQMVMTTRLLLLGKGSLREEAYTRYTQKKRLPESKVR